MSQSVFLPNYTIGTDAYEKANGIVKEYGTKVVLIGGKTALSKAENKSSFDTGNRGCRQSLVRG